jgi:hypothetical protein
VRPGTLRSAVACLALSACSGGLSSDDVRVLTDRDRYVVPDIAGVTVRNQSGDDFFLSSCAHPERREQGGWVGPLERVCPDDWVTVAPGAEHRFVLGLNTGTVAGVYRLRVRVSDRSSPLEAGDQSFVSNLFSVTLAAPER